MVCSSMYPTRHPRRWLVSCGLLDFSFQDLVLRSRKGHTARSTTSLASSESPLPPASGSACMHALSGLTGCSIRLPVHQCILLLYAILREVAHC